MQQIISRNHATSDVYFSDEETDFLAAMRNYQASTGKKFPTFTEILGVAKSLGYARAQSCHSGVASSDVIDRDEPFAC